jgi:hypothetical protein
LVRQEKGKAAHKNSLLKISVKVPGVAGTGQLSNQPLIDLQAFSKLPGTAYLLHRLFSFYAFKMKRPQYFAGFLERTAKFFFAKEKCILFV